MYTGLCDVSLSDPLPGGGGEENLIFELGSVDVSTLLLGIGALLLPKPTTLNLYSFVLFFV